MGARDLRQLSRDRPSLPYDFQGQARSHDRAGRRSPSPLLDTEAAGSHRRNYSPELPIGDRSRCQFCGRDRRAASRSAQSYCAIPAQNGQIGVKLSGRVTTQTQVRVPTSDSAQFVQGINLTSATTLVIGSMIGSGIFIVSADIARLVDSPALLILAWVVTGFMTVVGALTYGELAAMMPKAGGQYVFLRESLGPLWGFLYGWSMFAVIQTGTIAAVGVAFGKFLGVLFPALSAEKWIWHIGHVPQWQVGPMALGNIDVGVNSQNLVAIAMVLFLTTINVLGVKTGAIVQNIFT